MPSDLATAVQRFYPQVYLACHVDHVRARSTQFRLSAQDSSLLAHLDEEQAITAGDLARHLGVVPSTLLAAIKRLQGLGYLARRNRPRDRRQVDLVLTPTGAEAMARTSVLDHDRVAGVLAELTGAQRKQAVAGLALLARAARSFQSKQPSRGA